MERIYLDHCATTPLDPEVAAAMVNAARTYPGNPASQHTTGRKAQQWVEESSEQIREWLGGATTRLPIDQWLWTSGGTESNNLALLGRCHAGTRRVIVSSIEHPSLLKLQGVVEGRGIRFDMIRAREDGQIDLQHLEELLDPALAPPAVVCVMTANNETGVVQPLEEVVRLCRPRGIAVHTDASQSIGKRTLHLQRDQLASVTVSPHKFHGPVGVGGLLCAAGFLPQAILWGGSQQREARPGTLSIPLIAGFRTSLERALAQQGTLTALWQRLRDRFEATLQTFDPEAIVNGTAERLPHISNISFVGLNRQALLMALDLAGLDVSSGAACASGSAEPSHVLRAMHLPPARVDSAIRFSLGATTTEAEIDEAAARVGQVVQRLRGTSQ